MIVKYENYFKGNYFQLQINLVFVKIKTSPKIIARKKLLCENAFLTIEYVLFNKIFDDTETDFRI